MADWHAATQQAIEVAIMLNCRTADVVHRKGPQRVVDGHGGKVRVQTFQRCAQIAGQNRLGRVGSARVGCRVINLRDLLCRRGAADTTGGAISRAAVVQLMEDLRHAAGQPLSDSRMSALLAERGVRLARRTISKYRACGLMSS